MPDSSPPRPSPIPSVQVQEGDANSPRRDDGWRATTGRVLDIVTQTIDENLSWFRGSIGLACAITAVAMVSNIKGMRMYKSARQIPLEIFKGKMKIEGYIVTSPVYEGGTLRFRHRPLGGSILRSLFSSPFAKSSNLDTSVENTIRLRPFGVDLSEAERDFKKGVNASEFFQTELIDCRKLVTLTPLCLASLDGDLVDYNDLDEDRLLDEEIICIGQLHARVGTSNILTRLVNYRPFLDLAPTLLARGLVRCSQEDQFVLLACGGLEAMKPLLEAEREAQAARLGLWEEDYASIRGAEGTRHSAGGLFSRLRQKLFS